MGQSSGLRQHLDKHYDADGTEFNIFVQTLSGKTIQMFVKPTDTVDDLKRMIWMRENIGKEHQRLIWAGKQLETGKLTYSQIRVDVFKQRVLNWN